MHDLLERARVAGDHGQVERRVGRKLDAVLARPQRQQVAAIDQRRARRERLRRDLEIAGLHLRHVEDAVDDRQQMLAGIVDQLRVFLAARRIQHQRILLHDHLGESDDRIQRRAQLMAHGGKETRLGGIGRLRRAACEVERLLLHLAVGDVAHHGDHLGFGGRRLLQQPAAHLDPDEIDLPVASARARRIAAQPELDAAGFTVAGHIRQRGEIGRPVGDMDAVEQAMADEPRDRGAQHRFGGGRDELHRAVAAMARDHVAHVARKQAIAVFLRRQQRDRGARERLGAESKASGIERRRGHAERGQHAARGSAGFDRRQHAEMAAEDQDRGTGQRQRGGKGDHAARRRQRRFEGNQHQPDRGEGFDAAGRDRDRHHESREGQRRQHMRAFIAAGARQEPGDQDRRDQPGEGGDLERTRARRGRPDRPGISQRPPGCRAAAAP